MAMAHHNTTTDILIAWLRDAYAMEKALIPVLENHAKDAAAYPDIRARIEQHAAETREHQRLVEQCLRQLGEEPSTTKNVMAKVMGAVQSVATGAFHDEVVKNALQDFGTENFEIACYRALAEAAGALNRPEIVTICENIRREEESMARFLEQNLPDVVHDTIGVTV
jgi:ferritin-like metal-binding protein YciE